MRGIHMRQRAQRKVRHNIQSKRRILSLMLALVMALSQFTGVNVVRAEENNEVSDEMPEELLGLVPETHEVVEWGNCGADGDNVKYLVTRPEGSYEEGVNSHNYTLMIAGQGAMANNGSSWDSKFWHNYYTYTDSEGVYHRDGIIKIVIGDQITFISDEAFKWLECEDITIGNSVETIGRAAFHSNHSLKTIHIPGNVKTIDEGAFRECSSLENVSIENGVEKIGDAVFIDCNALIDIAIPKSVKVIGEDAFYDCKGLTNVTLEYGLTKISYGAFRGCTNLTEITIPESVTEIRMIAFIRTGLTEITIPASVTDIGNYAFELNHTNYGTPSTPSPLKAVHMRAAEPAFEAAAGSRIFGSNTESEGMNPDFYIYVPDQKAVEAYKEKWPYYQDRIVAEKYLLIEDEAGNYTLILNDGHVLSVDPLPWEDKLDRITKIVIKEGVAEIPDNAFSDCKNLKTVEVELDAPIPIGENVFGAVDELTEDFTIFVDWDEDWMNQDHASDWNSYKEQGKIVRNQDYVDAAMEVVKEFLANRFEASNDISQDMFEAALRDVVTSAGYEVELSVEDFKVTPATTAEGGTGELEFTDLKLTKGVGIATHSDKITIPRLMTAAEKVEVAQKAVEEALENFIATNDTTKESLETAINDAVKEALEKAGIDSGDITITLEGFDKKDATTATAGEISGSIKIESGDVESADTASADVPVNKTIAKLPPSEAEKVAAVKKVIEDAVKKAVDEALEGVNVTNENAKEIADKLKAEVLPKVLLEVIPGAVSQVLTDMGASPDEVRIDTDGMDITIDPATEDGEGSIKITIPITSTSEENPGSSDKAEVQIVIAKPDESGDPGMDAEEAKAIINDVLKKLTITNETTEEEILAALKEAFGEKAIVDGIEDFVKVKATEDESGSISFGVKLIINGKELSVDAKADIAQLSNRTGVYVLFTDYVRLDDNDRPCYKYTGNAIKPAVEVYNNDTLLTPGKDYTISYKNNTKVGSTAALTVKGKGNFSGTSNKVSFTIIHADIKEDTDHPTEMTVVAGTKVAPVIMNGAKKLTAKDYELTGDGLVKNKYASATAAGSPNILTVKGIGNYAGSSFEIRVTVIEKKAAKKLAVTVDKNFKPIYDGSVLDMASLFVSETNPNGVITVTDSNEKTKILKEGTDFTVVCTSSLLNAGTVKFMVTGMGAYTGSVNKTFKINSLKVTDSNKFDVTFDDKTYEYRASGATVDNLVVKYLGESDSSEDDKVLTQDVDYKITYTNNKKVSASKDAGIKITFLGNYNGSVTVTKTFKVVSAKLSGGNTGNTIVTVPDKIYSKANKSYKSTPIVTVDGATIKASNYTVAYAWATASQAADDKNYISDNKVKITIAEGDAYAVVKVTITPKSAGCYGLAENAVIEGKYYVRKAESATDLSKAKVTFLNKAGKQLKTLEYNGKTFYTPAGNNFKADNAPDDANAVYVKVMVKGVEVDPSLYNVTWTNATAKGKATVVIRGTGAATEKGAAVGSKNQTINIKAMVLKGKTLESFMEKAVNAVSNLKNMFF